MCGGGHCRRQRRVGSDESLAPGATILSFDTLPIATVSYDTLEHVTLTRAFPQDPEAYLRRL